YQWYVDRSGPRPTIAGRGVRMQPRAKSRWATAVSVLIIAYLFISLALPLAMLLAGSFNKLFGFFFLQDGWTATHWARVFGDPRFTRAAVVSTLLGLAVGVL